MNAKQKMTHVMLSVRIPVELRTKLRQAARKSGNSMAKEIATLIDTQLHADYSCHVQYEMAKVKASICQKQLESLETLVLNETNPERIQNSLEQISSLHKFVENMRKDRFNSQKKMEAKIKARAKVQIVESRAKTGTFFGRMSHTVSAENMQLNLHERRRLNFLRALAGQPKGTKKRLALELIWSQSQISQLLSSSNAKGHRTISNESARKLEKGLGLEVGSLDKIESEPGLVRLTQEMLKLETVLKSLRI